MARVARTVIPHFPHHIVQRGHNKQKIFKNEGDLAVYYSLLLEKVLDKIIEVKAYCFMPNHVHLLVVPSETNSLAKAMHGVNTSFGMYKNKKYNMSGKIWEGRFYSSVVDRESYLWAVMRYIEMNPVRAGMVGKPTDFFWSSARFSMGMTKSDLITNPYWSTELEKKAYQSFLQQVEDIQKITTIRLQTRRGRLIGDAPKYVPGTSL